MARNRFNISYLGISSSTRGASETLEGGGVGTTGEGDGDVLDGAGAGWQCADIFVFAGCPPFGPNEAALVRTREGFATAAGLTAGAAPTTDEP